MDYQKVQSTHEAEAKRAYVNQAAAQGASLQQGHAVPTDPARMRHQYDAFCMLIERLNAHRSRLRDIADTVLGEEPPEPTAGMKANIMPVGGLTAEIVMAFENAGDLLTQIDRQIERLERVSR